MREADDSCIKNMSLSRDRQSLRAGPNPIAFVLGHLFLLSAAVMLLPFFVDLLASPQHGSGFLVAAMILGMIGLLLLLINRGAGGRLTSRQMLALTLLAWVMIAFAGALPFLLSPSLELSLVDALFESVSGITTTGATIFTGLDNFPAGLLLWRALLQWLGGLGFIATALAILPVLRVGGMQLFRMESSERSDKALPRIAHNMAGIVAIYIGLTAFCAVAYDIAGMEPFEAIAHALSTVSTGGFSTRDESLGAFSEPMIHWIAIVFMIMGSLPFILMLRTLRSLGRSRKGRESFIHDSQVHWMLTIIACASFVLVIHLLAHGAPDSVWAMRHATFNLVSYMTGTGYTTLDLGAFGAFPTTVLFFIMFLGGCAGSTTGGFKIYRLEVLAGIARAQIRSLVEPNGVFVPYYGGRPISNEVASSVMGFFFLYIAGFAIITILLSSLGLDLISSLSGSAATLANVGPGLGPTLGPSGNYAFLPELAKIIMILSMLLGRLELFAFFALATRSFWR